MSVELVCCHSCAGRNPVSFVLRFLEVLNSHRSQAGSGPAATHFLCFAKESKQRKATTLPLAFGFPIVRGKKWESFETRFPCRAHLRLQANIVTQAMCMHIETPAAPQTTKLSLSIFCLTQLAVSEVDEGQNQLQNQNEQLPQWI